MFNTADFPSSPQGKGSDLAQSVSLGSSSVKKDLRTHEQNLPKQLFLHKLLTKCKLSNTRKNTGVAVNAKIEFTTYKPCIPIYKKQTDNYTRKT